MLFPVYFDYSSTTPTDPRVIEKLIPYLYYKFGNYSSKLHYFGWINYNIIENYRTNISKLFNIYSREILFNSSCSESNNFVLKGISSFYRNLNNYIITLNIEHKSIIKCCEFLIKSGNNVIFLKVKCNGLLNLKTLKNYFIYKIILFVIMYVNNEIGVINNINYISLLCRNKNIILYVDAAQAIGKVNINLFYLKIDILCFSSHKNYGPKGISGLFVRRKSNIYLHPLIHGGGQEKNLRSGTLATSLIIGFCESLIISKYEMFFDNLKYKNYKNIILIELLKIDSIYINGDLKYRIPNNLNISFDFIEGESLIISIKSIALSTGSACASDSLKSSYVIKNLNKFYSIIHSSIRITLGKFNNLNDIDFILFQLFKNVKKLRNLSPLNVNE